MKDNTKSNNQKIDNYTKKFIINLIKRKSQLWAICTFKRIDSWIDENDWDAEDFEWGLNYAVNSYASIATWNIQGISMSSLAGLAVGLDKVYVDIVFSEKDQEKIDKELIKLAIEDVQGDDEKFSLAFMYPVYWDTWRKQMKNKIITYGIETNQFIDLDKETDKDIKYNAFIEGYENSSPLVTTNDLYYDYFFAGLKQYFYKMIYINGLENLINFDI